MLNSYFFLLAGLALLSSCQLAPTRSFNVRDLLIGEGDLPQGWALLSVDDDPIAHFGESEAAEMIFYYGGNADRTTRGGVTIYQYGSERKAIRSYDRQEQGDFNEDSRWFGSTFMLEDFSFNSTTADEQRFGCHVLSQDAFFAEDTICIYLARYEEFVVSFSINVEYQGESTVTTRELKALVDAVDQRVSTLLVAATSQP